MWTSGQYEEVKWIRGQFGSLWDIEYPEGWIVNESGLIKGKLELSGEFQNETYKITLEHPVEINFHPLEGEGSINHEANLYLWTQILYDQGDYGNEEMIKVAETTGIKLTDITKKEWDDTDRYYSKPYVHRVYVWNWDGESPGTITIEPESGSFDSQKAERLLDRSISGIK